MISREREREESMRSMVKRGRWEKRSAANGIDWKDDAPGWWLAGLKRRERIAVGWKARTPWIPSAYEVRGNGGKRRERGRGGANQVLISRCGNFGGNWSTHLRSIP